MVSFVQDADIKNKSVIVRVDYNVPLNNKQIVSSARIDATIPTLEYLLKQNCKIIIISHLGRPNGIINKDFSLEPVSKYLKDKFNNVFFLEDCVGKDIKNIIKQKSSKDIIILENLRFHKGEELNDHSFAKELASLADIYVNDAFGCSHRKHASIYSLPSMMPSYAGLLLQNEILNLEKYLSNPKRPFGALIGGAKISSKISLINSLIDKVDVLLIGGAMANSFLKAKNIDIGDSLVEDDYIDIAKEILEKSNQLGVDILLPIDFITAKKINTLEFNVVNSGENIGINSIYDIGPKTIKLFSNKITNLKTLIWNGPVGAFEFPPFNYGTISLASNIATFSKRYSLLSIAGGGDSLAAIYQANLDKEFTYLSTGGGAFLKWLEETTLPGVKALTND